MKRNIFLLISAFIAVSLTSCVVSEKKAETQDAESEQTTEYVEYQSEEVEEETPAANTEDWDAVLDDYEKFVDSYVKLYKKAMAGDMSAMSEYADVLSDAERLSNKLSNAKSDLSPAQLKRYTKIVNKLTSVY